MHPILLVPVAALPWLQGFFAPRGETEQGSREVIAELAEYRRYRPHELKPWPRATGFAVADWMTSRGLAFEYADFPGAAAWLARADRR